MLLSTLASSVSLVRTSCVWHNISLFAQEHFKGVFIWFFVIIAILENYLVKFLHKYVTGKQNASSNNFSNKSKQLQNNIVMLVSSCYIDSTPIATIPMILHCYISFYR